MLVLTVNPVRKTGKSEQLLLTIELKWIMT